MATALGDVLGWTAIVVGVALTVISAAGLHRFTSVFARMQVAGKATTLGILLILLGAALAIGAVADALTLLLGAALLLATAPVGFTALGRAADRVDIDPPWRVDERAPTGEPRAPRQWRG